MATEVLKEESASGALAMGPHATASSRRRYGRAMTIAGVVLAGASVIAVMWSVKETGNSPGLVLKRLTSDSGLTADPAVLPDSTLLAYASDRAGEGNLDIWVQSDR